MKNYDHNKIEKKWQKEWEKKKIYQAKNFKGKKFYSLIEFPYPSGAGLHVGHIRSNTAIDIINSHKDKISDYKILKFETFDDYIVLLSVVDKDNKIINNAKTIFFITIL